jgi:Rod binding domain-containing protein
VSFPFFAIISTPASGVSGAGHSEMSGAKNAAELAKLEKASGEFESILLQTLWKSMKETFSDGEDKDSDPILKNFDDFGMQAMAGVVGSTGGLGIKGLILKYLEPTLTKGQGINNTV